MRGLGNASLNDISMIREFNIAFGTNCPITRMCALRITVVRNVLGVSASVIRYIRTRSTA